MAFTGKEMMEDMQLFTLNTEGDEFFQESISIQPGFPARTEFSVNTRTTDLQVLCPEKYSDDYVQQYGPYSTTVFTAKIKEIYASFAGAERITNNQRLFVRKLWLFKQLFETFDVSMNMILVRMTSFVPNIYGKAINILAKAEERIDDYDERSKKYARIAIASIRRVYIRINESLKDAKFLKLLSPSLLEHFVEHATPYMVAKIRCLPWIEPNVALISEPGYNIYWTSFWYPFFKRNFRITSVLCFAIAEYMPIKLLGETFLDYFRRKYDANKGHFIKGRPFEIEKTHTRKDGHYWNKITIVFRD